MRLCHAGALALVGWYLLQPPLSSPGKLDTSAPLSKWNQSKAYDSAAKCEDERLAVLNSYIAHPKAKDADWFTRLSYSSRCVASDDPRLEEK